MSGGVIVVAAVVGALALFETVLPWAFAALRKWRRQAKEAWVVRTQLSCGDSNLTLPQSATSSLAQGGTKDSRFVSGAPPKEPCAPSLRQSENEGVQNEKENEADANRLWEEARGMTHRFKPDEIKDGEYLRKIQMAAELGHLEAMAKLGTYAFRRKRYVEAFYWRWRAEAGGWHETEKPTLREIRLEWRLRGCPTEYDNDFGEERGKFARTVLRLQCGVDAAGARQRLKRLAERGVEEARLFLGKHQPQGPACEVRLVGGELESYSHILTLLFEILPLICHYGVAKAGFGMCIKKGLFYTHRECEDFDRIRARLRVGVSCARDLWS